MDYKTRPVSRETIRELSKIIRVKMFHCKNKFYFDVVTSLEKLPIFFNDVLVEIVDDNDDELKDVPCTTTLDNDNRYVIKIKESVYEGAHFKKNGGYRMHIMHEMSHYILFKIGFKPYFDRIYRNNELKSYESIEWQAKALAGEILIPYEETKALSERQIRNKCKVSRDAAHNRIMLEVDNGDKK